MTVSNARGEALDYTKLRVFDSYIADRYLTQIMRSYTGKKILVLNQHADSKVYGVF
jgi:hypothetical protein